MGDISNIDRIGDTGVNYEGITETESVSTNNVSSYGTQELYATTIDDTSTTQTEGSGTTDTTTTTTTEPSGTETTTEPTTTEPSNVVIDQEQFDLLVQKLDNSLQLQVDLLSHLQIFTSVLFPLVCVIVLFWWFANQFFRR